MGWAGKGSLHFWFLSSLVELHLFFPPSLAESVAHYPDVQQPGTAGLTLKIRTGISEQGEIQQRFPHPAPEASLLLRKRLLIPEGGWDFGEPLRQTVHYISLLTWHF